MCVYSNENSKNYCIPIFDPLSSSVESQINYQLDILTIRTKSTNMKSAQNCYSDNNSSSNTIDSLSEYMNGVIEGRESINFDFDMEENFDQALLQSLI
jgi:hypothetical protein